MNPGIQQSIRAMVPAMRRSGLMASLCTITVKPGTFGDSGAPIASDLYTNLAGHISIPCSMAPYRGDENKTPSQVLDVAQWTVSLLGYYPAITDDHRAVIDGTEYDIIDNRSDSQSQTTSLTVQGATL